MNKTCFKKGCLKPPSFTCECKSGVYFCKKHMGDHMIIKRTHNIISLFVILDDSDQTLVKEKVDKVLKLYTELLKKAQNFCKTLIESVMANSKKLLDEIEKVSSAAMRVNGCLLRDVRIDIEDLKLLENIEVQDDTLIEFDASSVIKCMEKEFEIHCKKVIDGSPYDDFIFYNTGNSNMISLIDTKNFKLESKSFNSDNGAYSTIGSVIQLAKNIYFAVSSSNQNYNSQSHYNHYHCYYLYFLKIDISKNEIKNLYSDTSNPTGGGIVFHNGLIFMFSGIPCTYSFDIEKKSLNNIAGLPQNCHSTSASVINGFIYVTGYNLSYIYKFDDTNNTYSNTVAFSNGTFRYLFDNWLVSMGDSFYEIKDDKLINHGKFNDTTQSLINYSKFRRGNFIFFFTQTSSLYRIDTVKKTISLVKII